MPPFGKFTTKAKEAIKRAHELAIERGQSNVGVLHLLTALILQEESMVASILDKLEIDTIALTDALLDALEPSDSNQTVSPAYQMYLTPKLAKTLEHSLKVAASLSDKFVSTEHLFISAIDSPGDAQETLAQFKVRREAVLHVLKELAKIPRLQRVPKKNLVRLLDTHEVLLLRQKKTNLTLLLDVTKKFNASFKFCLVEPRTTLFLLEKLELEKLQLLRVLLNVSPQGIYPNHSEERTLCL